MRICMGWDWAFWAVGVTYVAVKYPRRGHSVCFHVGPLILECVW